MSERGVFQIDRGIWEHPLFAAEPFTEREAWMWLIGAAAWKAMTVRVGRAAVELVRGQCAFATRFLAVKWRWSEARVRRFLKRLEGDAAVALTSTRQSTLITICEYDKYQFGRRTDDAPSDAQNVTTSTHTRRKEEELKEVKQEEKKESRAVAVATRPAVPDPFEEFWKAYPRRDGANPKKPARQLFLAAVKQGADPAAIAAGARLCAIADHEKIGTPYIPQAVKWLRDRRWEDYAAGPPGASGPMLTDDERRRKFEELRNGSTGEGKNLPGPGAGARALGGHGRQEPAKPTDHQARHGGMVSLGGLFQRTPGLSAIRDDARDGRPEPGDDSPGAVARSV